MRTNWCGFGNTSKNNNDLGFFRRTDECCREHDRSLDNIPAFQTKHGITNRNLYTMTNCQDDCKFYNCLLNLRLLSSLFVGEFFFNIISAKCFAYTYPKGSIPGVSHKITTDVQDGGHKLVEIFQDSNGTVLGCNALGDK
ncbi:phospholipase A2-like [Ixodes scapularis]|uniref:phospholipase A2-like n=1 Tax=Ixodes scapularis TaxID=6945 RepID=UPI001A9DD2A3|nr:phospholipase A2-like [Ixodes scapularis]